MNSGVATTDEFTPETQSELSRFVRENSVTSKRSLFPVGGRTALSYGFPANRPGVLLKSSKLARIVDYSARDMAITVQAGIRMNDLVSVLEQENQCVPIDISQEHRATLGGAIATNANGPRRYGCGTWRDFVIGVSAVDARGRLFKSGGRVARRAAGYDLCKLVIGSLGTLAIVTEVTLRLRPRPEQEALLWMTFDSFSSVERALERMTTTETRPMMIEVLGSRAASHIAAESRLDLPANKPVLCLGVEGIAQECEWQTVKLREECEFCHPRKSQVVRSPNSTALRLALTEYGTFSDDPLSFQASLPPSRTIAFLERAETMGVSVQSHAGNGLVIGHLPEDVITADQARQIVSPLRQFVRRYRGNLIVIQCNASWKSQIPVFGEPESGWDLMRRLKRELDPDNLLNPGRFIDGTPGWKYVG